MGRKGRIKMIHFFIALISACFGFLVASLLAARKRATLWDEIENLKALVSEKQKEIYELHSHLPRRIKAGITRVGREGMQYKNQTSK